MKYLLIKACAALCLISSCSQKVDDTEIAKITIATVNNSHMIEMQKLTPKFKAKHPNIDVRWVILDENTLRSRLTTDITTRGGQFDIMTIGMYEAPIWAERGWLKALSFDEAYDTSDILPTIREGLSYDGMLYAAPFYGESSMIIYRKDILGKTGMVMPDNPKWDHVRDAAAAMTNKETDQYGICLRGKAGWGDNMAFISTMANSFGAKWFNEDWTPDLDSVEWNKAVNFYVNLINDYGPPGSTGNSFNEILALMNEGKCAMWIDSTIAASFVTDPSQSKVADKVAFAQSPQAVTTRGANWLWAWALAIPSASKNQTAASTFIEWATSKDYVELVAQANGWATVPSGTRFSTYANQKFKEVAIFHEAELKAILSADPANSTLEPTPYTGIQFVTIPEFQAIGTAVGQEMSAALAGNISVEEALANSQIIADREMRKAGYYE